MKERYFTPESLEPRARQLFQEAVGDSQKRARSFVPAKSALLILDMQDYFLDPASHAYVPSAEAILGGITRLIDFSQVEGVPVIFSQHINTEEDAGMMAVWWKDLITTNNPFHSINQAIDISAGTLIQKSQYDAFHGTQLAELLRAKGASQLVICGVLTHLCCETTARSAFMNGFEVFFPVDGTATYNLSYHRASLQNLAHGFATIVFMEDIIRAIQGEIDA